MGGKVGEARDRWAVAGPVLQFTAIGLVAVAIVGVATAVASRRVGQREAIVDARTTTLVKAQTVVEPVVVDGLLVAQPAAVARVDRVVHTGVLGGSLVRVKIWNRSGDIVYSDASGLEGSSYRLGPDELAALDKGIIEAHVSDLTKPENRYERQFGKLLEVYLPIRTPSGTRMLFEAYYRYNAVSASGARIWGSFAPVTIGALVALQLVQIPLAWSLAHRLRERQRDRERLLQHAIDASDNERRRIAGDLHDGVVQDLAGVAFSLAAASRAGSDNGSGAALLEDSAVRVRDSIKSLRSLLVDIYPPSLADAGLESALTDLLASTEARGVRTTLDVERLPQLPDDVARVLWRSAQEAIRNVVSHSHASTVLMRATADENVATLDVIDDGAGFDPQALPTQESEGHMGLRSLRDLVTNAGGSVDIGSSPGGGTHVRVEVPLP